LPATRQMAVEYISTRELRSLERALVDLRAKYARRPSAALARMIEQLQAEIEIRRNSK